MVLVIIAIPTALACSGRTTAKATYENEPGRGEVVPAGVRAVQGVRYYTTNLTYAGAAARRLKTDSNLSQRYNVRDVESRYAEHLHHHRHADSGVQAARATQRAALLNHQAKDGTKGIDRIRRPVFLLPIDQRDVADIYG